MGLRFTKMHGAGNDFLVFDHADVAGLDLPSLAATACDRHFGVGADGILIAYPSGEADFEMVYFNSDGSPSEMCGNGIRCISRYVRDMGIVRKDEMTVMTGAGAKLVSMWRNQRQ